MWDQTEYTISLSKDDIQRELNKLIRKKMKRFFPGAKDSQVKIQPKWGTLKVHFGSGENRQYVIGCNIDRVTVDLNPG